MLPQMDVTTFPSQVVFLILSFLGLFFFLRRYVVPDTEELLHASWETKNFLHKEIHRLDTTCVLLNQEYADMCHHDEARLATHKQNTLCISDEIFMRRKQLWLTSLTEEHEKTMIKVLYSLDQEWGPLIKETSLKKFTPALAPWHDLLQGKVLL